MKYDYKVKTINNLGKQEMKELFKVNSCEFNCQYDNQIYFPYRIFSLVTRLIGLETK